MRAYFVATGRFLAAPGIGEDHRESAGNGRGRREEADGHALARVETLVRTQLRLPAGSSTGSVRTFREAQKRELRGSFEAVLVMQTAEHRPVSHPSSSR
jgi:hypothetical protein